MAKNTNVFRKNKTRQDRLPMDQRERVQDATALRSWAMEHKPVRSADWEAVLGKRKRTQR